MVMSSACIIFLLITKMPTLMLDIKFNYLIIANFYWNIIWNNHTMEISIIEMGFVISRSCLINLIFNVLTIVKNLIYIWKMLTALQMIILPPTAMTKVSSDMLKTSQKGFHPFDFYLININVSVCTWNYKAQENHYLVDKEF